MNIGLHELRYKAKIVHRDVSPNNIMVEMRNGEPFFILNDFDLATFVQDNGKQLNPASSRHRTGTLPFMAIELLQDTAKPLAKVKSGRMLFQVVHRLRHDWESLLWVALWCMLTMDPDVSGTELETEIECFLSDWEMGEFRTIANVKLSVLSDSGDVENLVPPRFQRLLPWFKRWCCVLKDSWVVVTRHRSLSRLRLIHAERETLEGTITLEKLKDALHAPDVDREETEELLSDASSDASEGELEIFQY